MPPKAPSGATHMISRITPKTTFEATSKTLRIALRWRSASIEIDAATRIASTRMRRISFSTNGETKLVGSRSSVMKPTRPGAVSPASAIDSLAASRADAVGSPSKPEPGREDVGRDQAERERDDRHREEVGERAQREPARAREVAERGDADHDRDEDHRAGDRLDQLDEGVGQPFRLLRRPRRDEPDDDAEGDRDDHPEPQLFEDPSLLSWPAWYPLIELSARTGRQQGG